MYFHGIFPENATNTLTPSRSEFFLRTATYPEVMKTTREEKMKLAASLLLARPSTERSIVPTIDTLRGIMFIMVFHIHFLSPWYAENWASLARIMYYATDFVPVMFLAISVLGNMVQMAIARHAGTMRRQSRRRLLRVGFLVTYAELFNIITLPHLGGYSLLVWNVVLTIAAITVLLPAILKLKPWARIVLAGVIAMVYFPLQIALVNHAVGIPADLTQLQPSDLQDPLVLIYFIFFYQGMMTPIFSCLLVPLLSTVIFEPFANTIANHPVDPAILAKTVRRVGIAGLILLGTGIITGIARVPDNLNSSYVELLAGSPYFVWPFPDGIFLFLIRHTPQDVISDIGITLILFAVFAHFQMIHSCRFRGQDTLNILGRLSLSGFHYSLLTFWVPLTLDLPTFYLIVIPLLLAIVVVFRAWYTRLRRIGTFEWMMDVYVNTFSYFLDRRIETSHKSVANKT